MIRITIIIIIIIIIITIIIIISSSSSTLSSCNPTKWQFAVTQLRLSVIALMRKEFACLAYSYIA